MTSADLGYLKEERLQRLRREIGDVGAMSKAMIPGEKTLESLNPWTLGPSSTTKLEKNHFYKDIKKQGTYAGKIRLYM